MGYLFCADTKAALVNRLIQAEENEQRSIRVIAHSVVGSKLWMVVEYAAKVPCEWFDGRTAEPGETFRCIHVALLSSDRKSDDYRWGYNDYSEVEHPYHYSCPLKFLKLAPERCPEWRAKVREWHAEKRKIPAWTSWTRGDVVEVFKERYTLLFPCYSRSYSGKQTPRQLGWEVRRIRDDRRFRLVGGALRAAVLVEPGGAS